MQAWGKLKSYPLYEPLDYGRKFDYWIIDLKSMGVASIILDWGLTLLLSH